MQVKISYRLVRKKKQASNSELPILIRIRSNDLSAETTINSGSSVLSKYWKKGSLSNKCPEYTTISRNLSQIRQKIEDIVLDLEQNNKFPTPKLVKQQFEQNEADIAKKSIQPLTYEECWSKFLKKKEVETSKRTYIMYKQVYKRLDEFAKFQKVKLSLQYLVSSDFETDFKDWSWNVRSHTNSFVRKNFSNIKSFLNYCKDNDYIKVKLRNYSKPNDGLKVELVYLTSEEVQTLYDFKTYNYVKGKTYPRGVVPIESVNKRGNIRYFTNWELSKDLFIIMCCIGCRWGDLHTLSWEMQNMDYDTLQWLNQKTKKYTKVSLAPMAVSTFKKYGASKDIRTPIFPKYSQAKFNKTIKKVFKHLNLKRLISVAQLMGSLTINPVKQPLYEVISSHAGRRTFIMHLLMNGVDYKSIMSMTGHSDIKSLMKYISVSNTGSTASRYLYSSDGDLKTQVIRKIDKLSNEQLEKLLPLIDAVSPS